LSDDARLELVYSEALRALERQQQTVREFSAAFLGAVTLERNEPSAWSWIAIGALAGVGGLHVVVLWPRWTWRFRFEPQALVDEFVDQRAASIDDMHRELIRRIQADLDANLYRRIALAFRLASGLFLVETAAWPIAVSRI
jgi:hypothetical protein